MNPIDVSPSLPVTEYQSSPGSGNSSKPCSIYKTRELPNKIVVDADMKGRHIAERSKCPSIRSSTAENIVLNLSKSCTADPVYSVKKSIRTAPDPLDHSKRIQASPTSKAYVLASSWGYTRIMNLSSPNVIVAMLNLGFSVPFMNCRVWDGTCELVKENDSELLGDRGGQLRKKCFRVNASAFKPKPTKVGTSDGSRLRGVSSK